MGCSVSSSRRLLAHVIAAAATASTLVFSCILSGCSTAPPGTVDHELSAIDFAACLEGRPPCVHVGDVQTAESIVPDSAQAVRLIAGSSISAPLQRPSTTARLQYLVVGVYAVENAATLEVDIDDALAFTTEVHVGFSKPEIWGHDVVPGAKVTVRCVTGKLDVNYVIGRWND